MNGSWDIAHSSNNRMPVTTGKNPDLVIRPASRHDTVELCTLLNDIIRLGGTTAIEEELSEQAFGDYFLHGDHHICCFVAIDEAGTIAGFQALEHHPELPSDWADIATFARGKPKVPGVGTALFAKTRLYASQKGIFAINATIRADNAGGLAFYDKMGYQSYSVNKAVRLSDGTCVDRISKRFSVLQS